MTTHRVYVLTIPYPGWLCESDRSLVYTILRRRSDGPLIVREHDCGNSRRTKDRGKLRYTSRRPYVRAIFADFSVLRLVQEELRALVPGLPTGMVRHERRRIQRTELPCTCGLPGARVNRTEGMAGVHTLFPSYDQVATCLRHAQLIPASCAHPLVSPVQQPVQELPGRAYQEVPLVLDELPVLIGHSGKTISAAQRVFDLAVKGRKFALHL